MFPLTSMSNASRFTLRNQLDQDGFVVLEDFLRRPECDEMLVAGFELTKQVHEMDKKNIFSSTDSNRQQLREKYFIDSNDKIRFFFEAGAVDPYGKLQVDALVSLNKVGHALHLLHPIFRCYTYCNRVKAVLQELGFKEPAVVQSMYMYKNPGVGSEVMAHQDSTYLHAEPIPTLGFWIALEDATVKNGCLWIAGASHNSGVHRRLITNPDKDAKQILLYDRPAPIYPSSSFTPVPVRKGSCILLHGNVVHKSDANKSEKSRQAYTFHVVEMKNNTYSPENWLQEGENAPFLNAFTTRQML